MKKVLILNNAYYDISSYVNQSIRLKEEFEKLGVQADVRKNDFFATYIDGEKICSEVEQYDFCVYLDKDKYVSEMLEKSGMRIFNKHRSLVVCDDKMCTYIALSQRGVKMPKTLAGLLCYNPIAEVSQETICKIENAISYPIIVKESYGSLGKSVYKAEDRPQLIELCEKVKNRPHHFQEYIRSSSGRDVRVIVIGGKTVTAMLRHSEDDFRSNLERGGIGIAIDLPKEFKEVAERVATVLDLDYCGVDILFGSNGEPIVCEVNSNAFFGGIEKVTGVNVAKTYAEYMLKNYKKN